MSEDNVAVRKPVKVAARWLARLEAAAPLIRMASLSITGLSTALLVLKQYGHGRYAWAFIGVLGVMGVLFVYGYTEGGVYNQQKRDRAEMGANFAPPMNRIDNEMIVRAIAAADKERELTDEERMVITNELDDAYMALRDGIDIEEIQNNTND